MPRSRRFPRPPERLLYSVAETAHAWGVSERSVYRDIRDGRVPVVRMRHRVLVPKSVVTGMAEAKEAS